MKLLKYIMQLGFCKNLTFMKLRLKDV